MTTHVSVIPCHLDAFPGYRCTRGAHEEGGCTVMPRWWNLIGVFDRLRGGWFRA